MQHLLLAITLASLASGCASTNFATSSTPATVTEQRVNLDSGLTDWGENRVYRIGNIEVGYYGVPGAAPQGGSRGFKYVVDPGPTEISVWYYDNAARRPGMANQTDIEKLAVVLQPNGHYELRSKREAGTLQFSIVDLESNSTVATSKWVDIVLKAQPQPPAGRGGTVVPVPIISRAK